MAPKRNNRITESATKENRETKRKAGKAIQETNGKTTRRKDKTSEKGGGTRRTTKGRGKTNKKGKHGKAKRQGCPGGTMLIAWVSTGETHHDDDGHAQASVCWADLYAALLLLYYGIDY